MFCVISCIGSTNSCPSFKSIVLLFCQASLSFYFTAWSFLSSATSPSRDESGGRESTSFHCKSFNFVYYNYRYKLVLSFRQSAFSCPCPWTLGRILVLPSCLQMNDCTSVSPIAQASFPGYSAPFFTGKLRKRGLYFTYQPQSSQVPREEWSPQFWRFVWEA